MKKSDDINLRVCIECDAPLPNCSTKLNYFNFDPNICDDCFKMLSNEN